jgi:Protein of unknown function (DUF4230)
MIGQEPTTVSERRTKSVRAIGWVLLGLAIGVLSAMLGIREARMHLLSIPGFSKQTTLTDSTVVHEVRSLQRLESVVYTLDQIVTGEHTYAMVPPSLVGDRILLIVHGDVTAGVDLQGLKPEDVKVDGRSVTLKLPPAQIFAVRVDNEKTRVYSRDTGAFSSPDPQLETEVRRHAEEQLRSAALQDGILENAAHNAKGDLTVLLHSLGFEQAVVE